MSKILLYDCKNTGHWELLVKTVCFKRSYPSGNHFRKVLLLSSVSVCIYGVWMRSQHPSISKSCHSCRVRQGALQGLKGTL